MPPPGTTTDDKPSFWRSTRDGLAIGSYEGHAEGVRTGLRFAEPVVIGGLAVIFILWVAHIMLGVNVRFELAPLLAGGGGGGILGAATMYAVQATRAARSDPSSPDQS